MNAVQRRRASTFGPRESAIVSASAIATLLLFNLKADTHFTVPHGVEGRPVESHSGAWETIIAGLYHHLITYALRSEETWGGHTYPLTI